MGINMVGVDMKARILKAVKAGIALYEEECGRQTKFGEPIVGFANTSDFIFDMFFDHDLCKHPRNVYNPAHSVIVYFLPYAEDIVESNRIGREPSPEWIQAYHDSTWATMKVNRKIVEELDGFGRLSSLCNIPNDWNEEKCGPEWSHKMAAIAAEMGEFGPAGSIMTKAGNAGRFGAILTDVHFVPEKENGFMFRESMGNTPEMKAIYEKYLKASLYEGPCSEELIAACPGNAISENGIDKCKCQEYCKTIFESVPTPDLCGKCFIK